MNQTVIVTRNGNEIDLADPQPQLIDIEDIAYSLSHINRFGAHTDLTVAQHSMRMAEQATSGNRLDALLHDAAEAYTGDVTRPMKNLLGPAWKIVESRIQIVVAQAFGLKWPPPKEILELDQQALESEMQTHLLDRDFCEVPEDPEIQAYRFMEMFMHACRMKESFKPNWKLPLYNNIDYSVITNE